jgi:hypothetical protein
MSRDSVVGIATRYWPDGPWIKFRLGRGFPQPSGMAIGRTQTPAQWIPVHSREYGRDVELTNHPL